MRYHLWRCVIANGLIKCKIKLLNIQYFDAPGHKFISTEYGPAEDDAALHRLLHEVRGECGEGGVHDEGDQEHEDREPGDRDQGEGEGGVEPDRLPRRPGRRLLLLLLGQRLNKVIHSLLDPVT